MSEEAIVQRLRELVGKTAIMAISGNWRDTGAAAEAAASDSASPGRVEQQAHQHPCMPGTGVCATTDRSTARSTRGLPVSTGQAPSSTGSCHTTAGVAATAEALAAGEGGMAAPLEYVSLIMTLMLWDEARFMAVQFMNMENMSRATVMPPE